MRRQDLRPAAAAALGVLVVGFGLTALSVVSMRVAYQRAYDEIASSCRQMSLLTVENARYFCAPVARVERAAPSEGSLGAPATHL